MGSRNGIVGEKEIPNLRQADLSESLQRQADYLATPGTSEAC